MNFIKAYEELDLLTTKLLDEVATVEEVANLESLIKSDSQLKKRYVSLIMQESLLHWETGTVIEFSDEALYKSKNRSNVVPIISSVAAGIVAIFCAWALNLKFDGTPDLNESSISSATKVNESTYSKSFSANSMPEVHSNNSPFKVELSALMGTNIQDTTTQGILALEKNLRFDEGALIDAKQGVVSWNRSKFLSVPSENGVLPFEGSEMMDLSNMAIDVDSQTASVHETLQVLDVRKLPSGSNAKVDAQIYLNSALSQSDPTEFELSVHALQGEQAADKNTVAVSSVSITADTDQNSWEKLGSNLDLPEGTDFLVVAISARRQGPQSLLPNSAASYADSLRVNLTFDSGKTIGPL